jgi:hypothetical protein
MWCARERRKMHAVLVRELKDIGQFEDLSIDGMVKLKRILKMECEWVD